MWCQRSSTGKAFYAATKMGNRSKCRNFTSWIRSRYGKIAVSLYGFISVEDKTYSFLLSIWCSSVLREKPWRFYQRTRERSTCKSCQMQAIGLNVSFFHFRNCSHWILVNQKIKWVQSSHRWVTVTLSPSGMTNQPTNQPTNQWPIRNFSL